MSTGIFTDKGSSPGAGGEAGSAGEAGSGGTAGTGGSAGQTGGSGGEQTGGNAGEQAGGAAGEQAGGAAGEQGGAAGEQGGAAGEQAGGAAGQGGSGCGPLEAPTQSGLCAAKPITMPSGNYDIDATLVTRTQYAAWLATNPSTDGQPTECASNSDFAPTQSCMGQASVCQGAACSNHPVVCVDWCDAYAYCKAVGKRLCGKIGGGGIAHNEYADASASQWYAACSAGGVNKFPYGNTYSADTCNGQGAQTKTTTPVASMPSCQSSESGYTGVYDLSGNVWEWEDSCDGGACLVRGGAFGAVEKFLACDTEQLAVGQAHDGTGFRCCSL